MARNTQKLDDIDKRRRLSFCDWVLTTNFDQTRVFFSDEKLFRLNGKLNSTNIRFWAKSRPENFPINGIAAHSASIMVWIAVSASGLIGPYFFDRNVD